MNNEDGSTQSESLSNWEYRILAISCTLQCAQLIDKIAREGSADLTTAAALQEPLFVLNPKTEAEVFPRPSLLVPGLTLVAALSRGGSLRSLQTIVQYAVGMLRLADGVLEPTDNLPANSDTASTAIDRSAPEAQGALGKLLSRLEPSRRCTKPH